jgi:acyl-CoA synthetase (AMP-forming)/AMP-acid ligase II
MHPQGINSPTFSPAPLDGSLTIPQLLEHHLEKSPNHTAYIYDDSEGKIVSVSFSRYIRTVHAACRRVLRDVKPENRLADGKRMVVGIFAAAG